MSWTEPPQEFFRFCNVSFLYHAMEEVTKNVDVLCLRLASTELNSLSIDTAA